MIRAYEVCPLVLLLSPSVSGLLSAGGEERSAQIWQDVSVGADLAWVPAECPVLPQSQRSTWGLTATAAVCWGDLPLTFSPTYQSDSMHTLAPAGRGEGVGADRQLDQQRDSPAGGLEMFHCLRDVNGCSWLLSPGIWTLTFLPFLRQTSTVQYYN